MLLFYFSSVVPGKKKVSYMLKVTIAERNGSKIANPTRQTYISLSEETAYVDYIVNICKQEFNDESLILVSANCLPVEDSEATRGAV